LAFASDTRKAFHVDLQPAVSTEWAVPRGRAHVPVTSALNLLETTLAVPMRQIDWPLPVWRRPMAQTWTHGAIVTTFTPIPANQADWPVPSASRWTDRTWTQTGIPSVATPFTPIAWPVPDRAIRPNVESSRGFTPALAAPFPPVAWTVPAVARRATIDWVRGFILIEEAPAQPVPEIREASRYGDAGTVKQAIATLLTGPTFERALVTVEQQYADGVVLERLSLGCVKTAELVGVPAQFPWVEIVLEETEPDVEVDYADKNSHALAIVYWANGDTEEIVSQRLERYILATRRVLRNETLMPMIGCFPVVRSVEEYGVVGRRENVASPYVKAAAISFVVTTIEA